MESASIRLGGAIVIMDTVDWTVPSRKDSARSRTKTDNSSTVCAMARVRAITRPATVTAFRKSSLAWIARTGAAPSIQSSMAWNVMAMETALKDLMSVASGQGYVNATMDGQANPAMSTTRHRPKHSRLRHTHSGRHLTPPHRACISPTHENISFWAPKATPRGAKGGRAIGATKEAWTPTLPATSKARLGVISLLKPGHAVLTIMRDSILSIRCIATSLRQQAASIVSHIQRYTLGIHLTTKLHSRRAPRITTKYQMAIGDWASTSVHLIPFIHLIMIMCIPRPVCLRQ